MCRSGIIYCAFSKVSPVSTSEEEENTVLRVFHSVEIYPFVVGLPLE